MIHGRNFTLVPYIGESGNVQTTLSVTSRHNRRGRKILQPGVTGWMLSSQVKLGRDGKAYALHQLHAQSVFAIVANVADGGDSFQAPGMQAKSRYVKPVVLATEDLRVGEGGEDFVRRIERALVKRKGQDTVIGPGMIVARGEEWVARAAERMNVEWNRVSQFVPKRVIKRRMLSKRMKRRMVGRQGRKAKMLQAVAMRSEGVRGEGSRKAGSAGGGQAT